MSDVKVVYDFEAGTINVEVLVEADSDGKLKITAGLPVLRPSTSQVTWTLVAGTNVTALEFDAIDGIKIVDAPPLLAHGISMKGISAIHTCTVPFTNNCETPNVAQYDIRGTATLSAGGSQHFDFRQPKIRFKHDPTIAVVTDPIGG